MGKILDTIIAIIFVSSIIGIFTEQVLYNNSTDAHKTHFSVYQTNNSYSQNTKTILQGQNYTYNDTGNSTDNFEQIASELQTKIAANQQGLSSGSITEVLASAFGLLSSLTIAVFFTMLTVVIQGMGLVLGLTSSLSNIPGGSIWYPIGIIGAIAVALMLIYLVIKIVEAVTGRNI